jgi:hypothetical protein
MRPQCPAKGSLPPILKVAGGLCIGRAAGNGMTPVTHGSCSVKAGRRARPAGSRRGRRRHGPRQGGGQGPGRIKAAACRTSCSSAGEDVVRVFSPDHRWMKTAAALDGCGDVRNGESVAGVCRNAGVRSSLVDSFWSSSPLSFEHHFHCSFRRSMNENTELSDQSAAPTCLEARLPSLEKMKVDGYWLSRMDGGISSSRVT